MDRISDTMIPKTITTREVNINYNNLKINFGSYSQFFKDKTPTNMIKAQTMGAIALKPVVKQGVYFLCHSRLGNYQGSHHQWGKLPIPVVIIT